MIVRPYQPDNYEQVAALYRQGDLYGGQFDEDRDSPVRLNTLIEQSPNAILVAEDGENICGTVSLIKDARTAFLFRFAVVREREEEIVAALYNEAARILAAEGHKQVLVYSPAGHNPLDERYAKAGFAKGGNYTCYWKPVP